MSVAEPPINLTDRSVIRRMNVEATAGINVGTQTVIGTMEPPWIIAVPAEVAHATWLRSVAEQLRAISQLDVGWDTYRAQPLQPSVVEAALRFLLDYVPRDLNAPWVVPLTDGGLQLEWHEGDLVFEAAFPVDDQAEVYARNALTGEEVIAPIDELDADAVAQFLSGRSSRGDLSSR